MRLQGISQAPPPMAGASETSRLLYASGHREVHKVNSAFRLERTSVIKLPALASAALLTCYSLAAIADTGAGPLPWIEVEADSFELLVDQERAVWRGSVEATQGTSTFRTSQLTLRLDQMNGGSRAGGRQAGAASQTQAAFELSADNVTYNLQQSQIYGSGDSQLRRGQELIRAERISYAVEQRVAYAIPGPEGRVLVRFYANPNMPVFPGSTAPASPQPAAD